MASVIEAEPEGAEIILQGKPKLLFHVVETEIDVAKLEILERDLASCVIVLTVVVSYSAIGPKRRVTKCAFADHGYYLNFKSFKQRFPTFEADDLVFEHAD